MIKLYIFETVADALAFEHPAPKTEPKQETLPEVAGGGINETPAPEQPPRKYRLKAKKVNEAKEAFKERIVSKAKARAKAKGTHACGKCGKPGHNAKTCPDSAPAPAKPDVLTQEQINHIKEMADQGATVAQIVMDTGLPSKVVKENMY